MIDVSSLNINESIYVRDLKLAEDTIKILTPADRMLVSIVPPTVLEEPTPAVVEGAPEAVAASAEPEVIKKGKKEEALEEGAAAPKETKEAKEEKK